MKREILKNLTGYLMALAITVAVVFILTFYSKNIYGPPNILNQGTGSSQFPVIPLIDQSGRLKTVYDFKGKLVVVDFWFAGCQPCLEEMKYFPALLKRYKGKLVILSITPDSKVLTKKLLERNDTSWNFLDGKNPDWQFFNYDARKQGNIQDFLQLGAFPSYFLIDPKGTYIGSPGSAVYGIEKELSGIISLNLTWRKFFENYTFHDLRGVFIAFNLLTVIFVAGKFFVRILMRRIRKPAPLTPETKG